MARVWPFDDKVWSEPFFTRQLALWGGLYISRQSILTFVVFDAGCVRLLRRSYDRSYYYRRRPLMCCKTRWTLRTLGHCWPLRLSRTGQRCWGLSQITCFESGCVSGELESIFTSGSCNFFCTRLFRFSEKVCQYSRVSTRQSAATN